MRHTLNYFVALAGFTLAGSGLPHLGTYPVPHVGLSSEAR